MQVKIKKLNENCILPKYQTEYSAGCDLHAVTSATVEPGETKLIGTGFAVEIPLGFAGFIFARSGMALKRGLAPANKVGVIDSDYRGEVMVAVHNHSKITQQIEQGERIAQLVILPVYQVDFTMIDEVTETDRGAGGFGSTGSK